MKEREVIIGYHAALAALKNPLRKVFTIRCTKEFYEKNKKIINEKRIKDLKILTRKEIDIEGKNDFHQGVMIKCFQLKNSDLNSIQKTEKNIIILDSLNDSQNVGAIIRTAYLFGIKTIIFNKDNSFKINPILIKASSGAFEEIKLIEVTNLSRTIDLLKKMGYWIVGLDIKSKQDLKSIPANLNKALIFGSESKGIRQLLLKKCDIKAKINFPEKQDLIDSLNVSSTVAIVLYDLSRK